MAVLVTGGAGYVGTHLVLALLERGEHVVVLDNLSTGIRGLVPEAAAFVEGDAGDGACVRCLIGEHKVDAIFHLAGTINIAQSIADPLSCYASNVHVTANLLEAAVKSQIGAFIVSSSAAVYAPIGSGPVSETTPLNPINPHGRSKLIIEWMLEDAASAHGLRYIALRYFNVAGADPKGRTGLSTPGRKTLIRSACQAALGRAGAIDILGTDFPTADGTAVRDYIHVSDLARAHVLALDYLRAGEPSSRFNCGTGRGVSVLDVVKAFERVSGTNLPVNRRPRRPGDQASLIADTSRIRRALNWKSEHDDIEEIVRSALLWERRLNGV